METYYVKIFHMADVQSGKLEQWLNEFSNSMKRGDYMFLEKLVPLSEKTVIAVVMCHKESENGQV